MKDLRREGYKRRHARVEGSPAVGMVEAAASTETLDWQEVADAELGTVITFEGIDLDEQAALELANFGRQLKTPEKEDPGGNA